MCLRSWYERNKHIFPASRWEPYDPEKKWSKYTVSSTVLTTVSDSVCSTFLRFFLRPVSLRVFCFFVDVVCLPVRLSVRRSLCLSIHLPVCLSINPFVCLAVYQPVCLSTCLSILLSVYQSISALRLMSVIH